MTTANVKPIVKTPKEPGRFRLPDIPQREPDEVTSHKQLTDTGHAHHIAMHVGNPETTLVTADRWIIAAPGTFRELARYPDLMVAFDVDPALYEASNGYIISEQGKPPDFVLEVASESTATTDTGPKRDDYARLGILEYWRFDETGRHHGARLAGDRLVNGVYAPIHIDQLAEGVFQGYSAALNLYLRWDHGRLTWHDPDTGQHIATFESERERADNAEARAARESESRNAEREARIREREARIEEREARAAAEAQRNAEREARAAAEAQRNAEREARATAEAQRNAEREARLAAEARIRELEELLNRQNS